MSECIRGLAYVALGKKVSNTKPKPSGGKGNDLQITLDIPVGKYNLL